MSETIPQLPPHFQKAIEKIKALEQYERYQGAFLFGSAARGDVTAKSDLDVHIIVPEENCDSINHPLIAGVKLDITFLSHEQLAGRATEEANSGRVPMLAESVILFDKTGHLTQLKKEACKVDPPRFAKDEYKQQQFLLYHANDKVERNIDADPDSALLAMHIGINDVLKIHYRLHGRWRVSNKRMFTDLAQWDVALANLLRSFLNTQEVGKKYEIWSEIIDYVVKPMGGRLDIAENVCECASCQQDIQTLLGL